MTLNWWRAAAEGWAIRGLSRACARAPRPRCRPHVEILEDRRVPAVHLAHSLPGMSFADTSSAATPPDTIIAVGPNEIVEAVNTAIEIVDKSGNVLMPP